MLIQGQVGPIISTSDGVPTTVRTGKLGDVINSNLQPHYYENTYRGNSFLLSVSTAAALTAYSGGAAGTPMLAFFNPVGSGKNAIITKVNVASAVAASAAGTVAFGLYFGTTATITGTPVTPWNMGTQLQSGSVVTGFRNVALTSASAASNVIPLGSYYFATAAGAAMVSGSIPADMEGSIIIPPGSYAALGGSAALTSATWLASLQWTEAPV